MLREHWLKTKKERKHVEMKKNRQGHYCLRRLEYWYFHPGLRVAETCVWQQVRTVKQIMLHYPGCLLWLRCLALVTGMLYSLTLAREWCAGGGQPQLQWPWGEQDFQLVKKQRAKPRGQWLSGPVGAGRCMQGHWRNCALLTQEGPDCWGRFLENDRKMSAIRFWDGWSDSNFKEKKKGNLITPKIYFHLYICLMFYFFPTYMINTFVHP